MFRSSPPSTHNEIGHYEIVQYFPIEIFPLAISGRINSLSATSIFPFIHSGDDFLE